MGERRCQLGAQRHLQQSDAHGSCKRAATFRMMAQCDNGML